jgi:hypothetical protein
MYFYTICVIALLDYHNLPVSHENCFKVSRDVYVYGDDIIVPTNVATAVLFNLEKYNCKVNFHKTFKEGNFRESCGVDAFGGYLVTPIYLRTKAPENRQQASEILSWIETARSFENKGYHLTSHLLFSKVESLLGSLPSTDERSPVLGRNHDWYSDLPKRYNRKLQRFEIKCWLPSPVYRTDILDGYAALQKCLLRLTFLGESKSNVPRFSSKPAWEDYLSSLVELDEKHLERSARYGVVKLKHRWVPTTLVGFG